MRKIPTLFLFFMVTSCLNTANCWITASNLVKITLKKASDGTAATITFNAITVSGTMLTFYHNVPTQVVSLPVNPDATETTFLFSYQETVGGVVTNKTALLTLRYSNEIKLISDDCGVYQYQTGLAIVETDFSKTKLINSSLLTTVSSNLEIYF